MEAVYFNPKTGDAVSVAEGKQPPEGWKLVRNPTPIFIFYYPHPCYLIDQDGWIHLVFQPNDCAEELGRHRLWHPLNYRYFEPPKKVAVRDSEYWWDPKSGKCYPAQPGDAPRRGWKKIEVPAQCGDLFVTYVPPWAAPQAYIDPQTGKVKWVPSDRKAPKGWKLLEFDLLPISDGEKDMLREKRRRMLERLGLDDGQVYNPRGDLANDDDFEREMNRLGWQRSPDGDWERIPARPPRPTGGDDGVAGLSTIEKLAYVFGRMIKSGHFSDDVVEKLKSFLSPECLLIMLGLTMIGGPTALILGGILLLFAIGQDFFEFCDALSAITTSDNWNQLDQAGDRLEKAIVGLGIDAVLAWLFSRSVKAQLKGQGAGQPNPWKEAFDRVFDKTETDTSIKIETRPEFRPDKPGGGLYAEYEGNVNADEGSLDVDYGAQTWLNETGFKGLVTTYAEFMIQELINFAIRKGLRCVRLRRVASTPQGANLLRTLGFEPVRVRPDGVGLWQKIIPVQ